MSVIMLPGNGMEEHVLVADLLTLKDAGFADGYYAVRDTDAEHVEQLALTPPDELPALRVVKVMLNGHVYSAVIDGYHRWEAAKIRNDSTIKVAAYTYADENSAIRDAFEANLKHGLKAGKSSRIDYAIWLYLSDENDSLSMRDIAKIVGLNVSSVSRAIRKFQEEDDSQDETEVTEKAESSSSKKLLAALHKFYQEERTVLGMFGKGASQRDVTHRARMIYNHIASLPKEKHPELLAELFSLNETLDAFTVMVKTPARTGKR